MFDVPGISRLLSAAAVIVGENKRRTLTSHAQRSLFRCIGPCSALSFCQCTLLLTSYHLQNEPALKPTSPPLLHLPLAFPSASTTPLTSWSTLSLYLPTLLSHFSSRALVQNLYGEEEDERLHDIELPNARFSHISYVKVYATCRLKRIWFSEEDSSQRLPWEFELYAEK